MLILYFSDDGIGFGTQIHPVCLPFESNENPKKWENRNVNVVGFATQDFSGTKGDRMKVASMNVFTQTKCNDLLNQKLDVNRECKYI